MEADERNLVPYEEELGQGGGFTARDALYILFRHKWKIICVFICIVTLGTLAVLSIPKYYRSQGEVLVDMGRNPLTQDSGINLPAAELPRTLRSEITIMQGVTIATRVVDQLGAERILQEPAELESLVERSLNGFRETLASLHETTEGSPEAEAAYLREIAIKRVLGGLALKERDNIIQANFEALDPVLAQDVLQAVMEAYVLRHIEVHRPKVEPKYFQGMADKTLAELTKKEEELEEFRKKYNITSIEDQISSILQAISDRESSMFLLTSQINATKARIQTYEQRLASLGEPASATTPAVNNDGSPTASTSPDLVSTEALSVPDTALITQLKRDWFALRKEEEQLTARYPDSNRLVQNKKKEVLLAEKMLAEERAEARKAYVAEIARRLAANPNAPVSTLQPGVLSNTDLARSEVERLLIAERAELIGHETAIKDYEGELARIKRERASFQAVETELARIQRDKVMLEESYSQNIKDLKRSEVMQEMGRQLVSRVEIIQPATLPTEPFESTRRRNFALVLFGAIFASLGLAFALEYLSLTFKTNDDIEKHLGLPVLAAISREEFKKCI